MKEVMVTAFEAWDGTQFKTASMCREYEIANRAHRLVGLTLEEVRSALDRTDTDLADVIEQAGMAIRKARREVKDFKPKARHDYREPVDPHGQPPTVSLASTP